MEEKLKVIVDTDILIKAYRGDPVKIKNLNILKNSYCISVISAIELIAGSRNIRQFAALNKVLKVYSILHINESISNKAFQIYKNYILTHELGLSDCLIAATSLEMNFLLYTDNKKDFDFIDKLVFYKEKQKSERI